MKLSEIEFVDIWPTESVREALVEAKAQSVKLLEIPWKIFNK